VNSPYAACGPDCRMSPPTGLDDADGREHQDCPETALQRGIAYVGAVEVAASKICPACIGVGRGVFGDDDFERECATCDGTGTEPGRYAFEHRAWISDEHGEEACYYLVSSPGLQDQRACFEPQNAAFEIWLQEHCIRVKPTWWTPERRYAIRNMNTGEIVADAILRSPLGYQGVTADLKTGKLIAADLTNVPRSEIYGAKVPV
jgi:hypothetical protein